MVNRTVFFHIAVNGEPLGRASLELFADKFSKSAENFRALSTGEKECGYKGSCFHRIIPGCTYQGGDFTRHNGTDGKYIYGEKFDDENFILKHKVGKKVLLASSGLSFRGFECQNTACRSNASRQPDDENFGQIMKNTPDPHHRKVTGESLSFRFDPLI
ncbi:hypothetical protein H8958_020007 [Nasalis larvatus]